MIKSLGKEKAAMTTGWEDAVKSYGLEEDDIVLFSFEPVTAGTLDLMLFKLPMDNGRSDDEDEQHMIDDGADSTSIIVISDDEQEEHLQDDDQVSSKIWTRGITYTYMSSYIEQCGE